MIEFCSVLLFLSSLLALQPPPDSLQSPETGNPENAIFETPFADLHLTRACRNARFKTLACRNGCWTSFKQR